MGPYYWQIKVHGYDILGIPSAYDTNKGQLQLLLYAAAPNARATAPVIPIIVQFQYVVTAVTSASNPAWAPGTSLTQNFPDAVNGGRSLDAYFDGREFDAHYRMLTTENRPLYVFWEDFWDGSYADRATYSVAFLTFSTRSAPYAQTPRTVLSSTWSAASAYATAAKQWSVRHPGKVLTPVSRPSPKKRKTAKR